MRSLRKYCNFNNLVIKTRCGKITCIFYRTEAGAEVAFILERDHHLFAIEVKASKNIGPSDLKGFQSFENFYQKNFNRLVLYLGEAEKKINQVDIFPWKKGLEIILTLCLNEIDDPLAGDLTDFISEDASQGKGTGYTKVYLHFSGKHVAVST